MSTAEDAPFEIRQADFFSIANAAWGLLFVDLAGASLVDSGSLDVPNVLRAVAGLLGFTIAGYYHFHPGSMDNGTDPAPRTWFEVAGFVIALGVLAIAVGVLLAELNSPLF